MLSFVDLLSWSFCSIVFTAVLSNGFSKIFFMKGLLCHLVSVRTCQHCIPSAWDLLWWDDCFGDLQVWMVASHAQSKSLRCGVISEVPPLQAMAASLLWYRHGENWFELGYISCLPLSALHGQHCIDDAVKVVCPATQNEYSVLIFGVLINSSICGPDNGSPSAVI